MCAQVHQKLVLVAGGEGTHLATERFFIHMHSLVHLEGPSVYCCIVTLITVERLFSRVPPQVAGHFIRSTEFFGTLWALEWLFSRVGSLVSLQVLFVNDCVAAPWQLTPQKGPLCRLVGLVHRSFVLV